jgi:uncharacterized protein YbjT (DUF2867 family)
MAKPKILVTGAAGKTGGAVARELLRQGFPVRALVRRQDARSEALTRQGAEVVVAEMDDVDQLVEAMRGVNRAYFVPLFRPYMLQAATTFAVAAREARLEAVVQLGQWLSHRAHPALLTRETWLVDQTFAMIPNIAHVIVNPGMFADNFLRIMDFPALLGVYPYMTGDSRSAPVSNEDIASTAAALLAAPERHAGRSYRPTGPQLLSGREMAAIIAEVVGHRVAPLPMPEWLFLKVARMQGVDPYEAHSYIQYAFRDARAGSFEFEGGVTDVVEQLTGRRPEDFGTIARRYAALPFARQTLGNRMKALAQFLAAPLWPGYSLARYERGRAFPKLASPSLSINDERWRRERSRQNAAARRNDAVPQTLAA